MNELAKERPRAVIFDLDGTLLDTLQDIGEAMNRSLQKLGLSPYPLDAYRQFVGEGATVLAEKVLPPPMRTEDNIKRLRDIFISDYRANWNIHTRPYDGVAELLDVLSKQRVPMAILSNKPHYFTKACVEEFLDRWAFQMVLGEGEGCPRKPDPEGALMIARHTGIKPEGFLFVGDTKVDMLTARNAGMTPCGVTWGFRDRGELEAHGARLLVDNPFQVAEIILQKDK